MIIEERPSQEDDIKIITLFTRFLGLTLAGSVGFATMSCLNQDTEALGQKIQGAASLIPTCLPSQQYGSNNTVHECGSTLLQTPIELPNINYTGGALLVKKDINLEWKTVADTKGKPHDFACFQQRVSAFDTVKNTLVHEIFSVPKCEPKHF